MVKAESLTLMQVYKSVVGASMARFKLQENFDQSWNAY